MARIAYLLNQYPAISHSFILREVRALRELGVTVETFSIHRSDPDHLLATSDQEEYERTYALRPLSLGALVKSHLGILCTNARSYIGALLTALGTGRHSLRALIWQLFYFLEAVPLWSQIEQAGFRHVHAHFTNPAADVAMIVADIGNRKEAWSWSFSAHGADIEETDQLTLAHKVRRAGAVVCVSDFGRSQLMTVVEPQHWDKIKVIHCGIDPAAFATAPRSPHPGPLRVLNVGRLVAVKGQALLLEAIAIAAERGVDICLTVVGSGPLRSQLEDTSHRLGVAGRVQFTGSVGQDEIRRCYAEADVFCLSSLREGVPVVLMEAMASGLPVVASAIMGIPELVEHEVSGLLVRPGRPDLLAEAIVRLASDGPLRDRLADAGRSRIGREYEIRESARKLGSLFHERKGVADATTYALAGDVRSGDGGAGHHRHANPR